MKGAAYIASCLAATILAIIVCFSASPAAAHGGHGHAPAAVNIQTSVENDSLAGAVVHLASVAAIQAPMTQAPDVQPCQAPCCTGAGCGCCVGLATLDDRSFAITPHASRELRLSHDRSRPSRSAEAPSEPPKSFQ